MQILLGSRKIAQAKHQFWVQTLLALFTHEKKKSNNKAIAEDVVSITIENFAYVKYARESLFFVRCSSLIHLLQLEY